jgi:hypothetical protein
MPMTRFEGILFLVGKPTIDPPCGAKGRNVLLSENAVLQARTQLIGKPIWLGSSTSAHHSCADEDQIGTITETEIINNEFWIYGSMTENPKIIHLEASNEILGLSYDANDCVVRNYHTNDPWLVKEATFIGANVLPRHLTAHKEQTTFRLVMK